MMKGKKGFITLEWLLNLLKGVIEVVLVIAIVFGAIAVIWRATKATEEDKDFKRVLDGMTKLMDDFDDGKIMGNAHFNVPIVSEGLMEIRFHPAKGAAVAPPPRCRGRSCVCMYYDVGGIQKETCKSVETKDRCSKECGKELCAGPYKNFVVKREDTVRVAITCTNQGSLLSVEKG